MYINPFTAGVMCTLFIEAMFVIGCSIIAVIKNDKEEKEDN